MKNSEFIVPVCFAEQCKPRALQPSTLQSLFEFVAKKCALIHLTNDWAFDIHLPTISTIHSEKGMVHLCSLCVKGGGRSVSMRLFFSPDHSVSDSCPANQPHTLLQTGAPNKNHRLHENVFLPQHVEDMFPFGGEALHMP